uniref:Uncharacterized protein n=1 Tax=Spongospora subterranea TaxID=70186 RepID=A0A0H5RLG3_9EUKA|eukprot:CRZ09569.1 hypothetical protein [Spongospora subterranea]
MSTHCQCDPLVKDGYAFNQFVGTYLAECVYTPVDHIPLICGLISTVIWIFALSPQIITNFKNKRTEALSPAFLLIWLCGDVFTFVGGIIAQQRATMIICAGYFCLNDLLLLAQMAYYSAKNRPLRKTAISLGSLSLIATGALSLTAHSVGSSPAGRALLENQIDICDAKSDNMNRFVIGCVISWIAGMLYFFSRIPQIMHTYKQKTFDGLNVKMFMLCIAANTFFGIQFIAEAILSTDFKAGEFCAKTLPSIIGSLGTLIFDAMLIGIYCTFRANDRRAKDIESR